MYDYLIVKVFRISPTSLLLDFLDSTTSSHSPFFCGAMCHSVIAVPAVIQLASPYTAVVGADTVGTALEIVSAK